jgi:hypothetical protein
VKTILWFLVFLSGAAAAQQPIDPCMKAYNDQVVAIEREAKARQKSGSEAAKQRAARTGEARAEAAARAAKKCQEEAKAKAAAVGETKPPPADECKMRINARMVELERRFSGAALDPAQQTVRRDEEIRLQAELNECHRQAAGTAAPKAGR